MTTRLGSWSRVSVTALTVITAIGTATMVRPPAAAAADVTVTNTADGGAGSLRDAFSQASASIAAPNTITLAENENYTLDSCVAADGDLDYTSGQPLTIVGNGSTIRQTCPGERVIESDGDITIQDTTITGGDGGAGTLGGGIEADTDDVTLVRSTVTANAGGTGGGVGAINVAISDSTVAGNQASSSGGGVWADQTVTATNSTITANTALAGGGIALVNTTVTLRYVTIAGNTAPSGANIELQPGSDSLVTFASVISLPLGGGENCDLAAGATTTSQGHNVTSDPSCDLAGSSDATAPDPALGPLAENGGTTRTRLPLPGSPLLDVVPCGDAPVPIATDQRGVARPQGGLCDVGAVEVEVQVPPRARAGTGSEHTGRGGARGHEPRFGRRSTPLRRLTPGIAVVIGGVGRQTVGDADADSPRSGLGRTSRTSAPHVRPRPPFREVVPVFRPGAPAGAGAGKAHEAFTTSTQDPDHEGHVMTTNGGEALIKSLEMEGVEVIFGLPGGAILPVYDPIIDSPIRHILVRHEQGAGHMAEGYAHATGRPGVAMVTSGPGATNIVTPLADAYMDSIPMVCITGQVATPAIGTDAFQECDTVGITRGVTKHNELVTRAEDIPLAIRQAFHIATTGRPGPVLVDIPKDIVDPTNPRSAMDWHWPTDADLSSSLPGYKPTTKGHPRKIKEAAELIMTARRPVIYAGGGILKARAAEALRELAELCDIPVVTTLMARGAFPDDHPLCLGMPGMHGNYTAVTSMQQSDLLIALGSRFDDRVTGKLDGFAPDAKIIHVDVDPAELGKVRRPDVPIVGDCRLVIEELIVAIRNLAGADRSRDEVLDAFPDRSAWRQTLSGWQEQFPLVYEASDPGGLLKPQYVLEQLRDRAPEDCIVASGVGQHQMWTSQYWKFNHPYTWVNSGGLGTMGFSVPAAIGAKVGRPDRMVWAVDGDGCFQMTAQEMVTASTERIPVKIAILNNAYLGMVRQWQEMFYDERYSEVYLSPDLPDYVKWAEAMGCIAMRVESPEEVGPAIDKANEVDDRPVVLEFRTDAAEKVYPMVPSGRSNDDIVVDPGLGEGGR